MKYYQAVLIEGVAILDADWLKRALLNPLVLACLAYLSLDGFYWLAGVFQAWLTALPNIFSMNSWKSHGKWVDSGLPRPDLGPQWPCAWGVCLSVLSHRATAFDPTSAKPTGIDGAGKTTTQQGTVPDLIWDCSGPEQCVGWDCTNQCMDGL